MLKLTPNLTHRVSDNPNPWYYDNSQKAIDNSQTLEQLDGAIHHRGWDQLQQKNTENAKSAVLAKVIRESQEKKATTVIPKKKIQRRKTRSLAFIRRMHTMNGRPSTKNHSVKTVSKHGLLASIQENWESFKETFNLESIYNIKQAIKNYLLAKLTFLWPRENGGN